MQLSEKELMFYNSLRPGMFIYIKGKIPGTTAGPYELVRAYSYNDPKTNDANFAVQVFTGKPTDAKRTTKTYSLSQVDMSEEPFLPGKEKPQPKDKPAKPDKTKKERPSFKDFVTYYGQDYQKPKQFNPYSDSKPRFRDVVAGGGLIG